MFTPSADVSVHRSHDAGRTAWWLLIALIPLIGAIVLLVFMLLDSKYESNWYEANPKDTFA